MKRTIFALLAIASTSMVSHGALTLTGLAVGTAYPSTPATAQLGLLLRVSGDGGWLNDTLTTGQNGLTSTSDPDLTSAQAGLDVGSTFGGNLVIGRLASVTTFMNGAVSGILGANAGQQFAIVWFNNLASTATGFAPAGSDYGIVSASTWTLGADGTTFGFGTSLTASNIHSRVAIDSSGDSTASFGDIRFATQGAAFSIIPEPSIALLSAIGVLGLLRRRR